MDDVQCRICRQDSLDCISLEAPLNDRVKLTLAETLTALANVSCNSTDRLPYQICDSCMDEVQRTYDFIHKIQESDEIFREYLGNNSSIPKSPEEDAEVDFQLSIYKEYLDQETTVEEEVIVEDQEEPDSSSLDLITIKNETTDQLSSQIYGAADDNEHVEYEIIVQDYPDDDGNSSFMETNEADVEYTFENEDCDSIIVESFSADTDEEYSPQVDDHGNEITEYKRKNESNTNQEKKGSKKKRYSNRAQMKPVGYVEGGTMITLDNGEIVHKCNSCEKEFKKSILLSNHIRFVHKRVRPFLCSMCPKMYPSGLRLKEHFRIHSGERPFKCDICGLGFIRKVTMQKHRLCHTGEMPHECEVCGKRFRQLATLRGHMFVHTGVGVNCEICNKVFARAVDVKKHMKSAHGKSDNKEQNDGESDTQYI